MRAILSFYSRTVGNQSVSTTEVHADIGGEFQVDRERRVQAQGNDSTVIVYCFIPDKVLANLTEGMKVTSSSNQYRLEYVESYDSHQEVYLLRTS